MTKTYCDACKREIHSLPVYFTIKNIDPLNSVSIERDVKKIELCSYFAERICNASYKEFNNMKRI